ncbi:MAG: hypothetical protein WBF54_15360 [Terriglobales bacterium]
MDQNVNTGGCAIVRVNNLPLNTTATEVREYIWAAIGLDVKENYIKITNWPNAASADLCLTRSALAEFLSRNLTKFNGRDVVIKAKGKTAAAPPPRTAYGK